MPLERFHPFKRVNNEPRSFKELTPGRLAVVNVSMYSRLLDLINKEATSFAVWKGSGRPAAYDQARRGLEDIYFANGDKEKLERLQKDWGRDFDVFENVLARLEPIIQQERRELLQEAPYMRDRDVVRHAWRAARRVPKLSHDQRIRMLEMAGYTHEERIGLVKKIGVSGGFSVVTSGIAYGMLSVALGINADSSLLDKIPIQNMRDALLLSYATHYGSLVVKGHQNARLLNSPDIEMSGDVGATTLALILKRLLPENQSLRDHVVRALAVGQTGTGEIVWRLLSAANIDPSIVFTRNVSGTIYNTLYAVVAEVILETERVKLFVKERKSK